jgi:hypothetical protein
VVVSSYFPSALWCRCSVPANRALVAASRADLRGSTKEVGAEVFVNDAPVRGAASAWLPELPGAVIPRYLGRCVQPAAMQAERATHWMQVSVSVCIAKHVALNSLNSLNSLSDARFAMQSCVKGRPQR